MLRCGFCGGEKGHQTTEKGQRYHCAVCGRTWTASSTAVDHKSWAEAIVDHRCKACEDFTPMEAALVNMAARNELARVVAASLHRFMEGYAR